MRGFLASFARNTVFANILLALIFLAGGFAVTNMVRETFPDMSLDMIIVNVPWPGADPEEVEEGICRKMEEAIEGIEGIKQYHTTSREHLGFARIEVLEGYDVSWVKDKVRNAVESISTFPEDAERPITEEMVFRIQVMLIALYGDDLSERDLKEWGERVKEDLLTNPAISQVQVVGARDYEISIELSEEKLREYGVTFANVAMAIRASSLNLPGGTLRTKGEEIRIRTLGRKYTAEEFAKIIVMARPNGDVITLDRIATIKDSFSEDMVIQRFNGKPSISVLVLKTTEEDTLEIDKIVRDYVARTSEELPEGMKIEVWGALADILRGRINLLLRNGTIGLVLVFVLLWLFLDIRLSFWAGMGMPISVMGALAIMWWLGATINMISLFALIMVLGIIVDDAIVVGEAIYVARRNGAPALRAAVDGVAEVGLPVIAAVTTTIVAFIPLCFVGGIMGKFIIILPIVVISCLAISLLECLLLLPAHLSHLPDPNKRKEGRNPLFRFGQRFHLVMNHGMEWFVAHAYLPAVRRVLPWRYVVFAVAVASLLSMLGFMESGRIKFYFFPTIDGNEMTSTIEFPNGTPIEVTNRAIVRIEEAVQRLAKKAKTPGNKPLVLNMFSVTGTTITIDEAKVGSNVGSVRVELLESGERNIHSEDLMAQWEEEIGPVPGAISLTFNGEEAGPPGKPIEVWLKGHNMDHLLSAADELIARLETYDGVYQIEHDYRAGKNEVKLRLKPEARALGLTVADLASQVYAGYFGEEAVRLQRGRDDIRVRVRYPAEDRKSMAELRKVRIRTPFGFEVPLMSVAEVEYGPGYAQIRRTDSMRRVKVTADVVTAKANPSEILGELSTNFFPELERKYPGLSLALEGEQRNMRDSFGSLYWSYPLALLGIFIIIASTFRSYLQPMVIMVTVPFGLIGAVLGHMVLGYDLSVMSYFGMVALSGVVVNDAIVLIECINTYIADGLPFFEAIAQGGARRFRAIFLTTVSTVGGLTPLIIERDLQARFLIPMGIAIAAGVAFATVLTLVLMPCLLCILNDWRRIVYWLARGVWPTAEEVEPARVRAVDLMAHDMDNSTPVPAND